MSYDVTDPAIYLEGLPHAIYAAMRAEPGLVWHPYESGGFWAATRHADVKTISMAPKTFSSALGHTNLWDLEADALAARRSIIDTDAPDHTRLRRLVSKAFAPNSIRAWEDTTRAVAVELLDDYLAAGGGDWVSGFAAPLPIRVILSILGVPVEDSDYLVELSNFLIEGTGDRPTLAADAYGNTTELRLLPFGSAASHALFEYGEQIGAARRAHPEDDVVTRLVQAMHGDGGRDGDDDRERLTPSEYRNLFHVLVFAGNETTRTALTHGAIAFANNPDQWQRLVDDRSLLEPAVEEILRWATPVLHMRRTAAHDTELAGTPIAAGDKVVMWYASANYDLDVFADPMRFDIGPRDTGQGPHTTFGGGGPHFCLGAFLARMEIRIALEELLARDVRLTQSAPEARVASNFVHGIASVELSV